MQSCSGWMFTFSNKEKKTHLSWIIFPAQTQLCSGISHFLAQLVLVCFWASLLLRHNSCAGAQNREVGENVSAFPDDNGWVVYNEVFCLRLSFFTLQAKVVGIQWYAERLTRKHILIKCLKNEEGKTEEMNAWLIRQSTTNQSQSGGGAATGFHCTMHH